MKADTINWVVNTVVKRLIFTHTPSIEKEELVSEGMIEAVRKMPLYKDGMGKESTYLYRVVRNHLLNYIRDNARSIHECPLEDDNVSYEEDVSRDTKITLNQIQETLSERDQVVFTMLREGYTQDEIATHVGITTRTIRRMLNAIKSRY